MQTLKDQVVNITGYSQQKSNNPKSFGKNVGPLTNRSKLVFRTLYLWSAPLLCGLACRAEHKTLKFFAILR